MESIDVAQVGEDTVQVELTAEPEAEPVATEPKKGVVNQSSQ